MLEAIFCRAEKLKQGVQVLLDISQQCWLQVNRVGLLFGVEMVDHRVPALLSLDSRGFQTYEATEDLIFSWNDTIASEDKRLFPWNDTIASDQDKRVFSFNDTILFNLDEFWDIIRLWDDDTPIRFSIPDSGQRLYVYSVVEPVSRRWISCSPISRPGYIPLVTDHCDRYHGHIIDSKWFTQSLLYYLVHDYHEQPLTIIVWRSMVMTISQNGQRRLKRRIFIKNYEDTTPHHKYSIFHLTLHRVHYFLKAARISRWIELIAEDNNKRIYVPPGIARMMAHIKENPSDASNTKRDISHWTKLVRKYNGHRLNVLNKPAVVMSTVFDRFTKITFYLLLDSVVQPCVEFGSSSPNFDLLE